MNVLMAHHAPWVGGTRTHLVTLVQELVRRGHHVVLMTDGGLLEDEMIARGISFVRRAEGEAAVLQQYRDLIRQGEIEILHAHSPQTILECHCVSELTGVPFIITIHGEYIASLDQSPAGREMARSAKAVIAVSDRVRDYLTEHSGVPSDKIHVILNGIDTHEFGPGDGAAARRSLGLKDNEYVIMYLGRLDEDKMAAIMSTAESICSLQRWGVDCRGLFVGGGGLQPRLAEMDSQVFEETGKHPFVLTGVRRDLPHLLSASNVVVATGRSALEAMSTGKPVVACGRAGLFGLMTADRWAAAQASNFGDHGVWPEPKPVELAGVLYRLQMDRGFREQLGPQTRPLVEADYDIRKVVPQLEALYQAVAG